MPPPISQRGALRKLLVELFQPIQQLELFFDDYYSELVFAVDFGQAPELAAKDAVSALYSHGSIDADLFAILLERDGGNHAQEIAAVRDRWLQPSVPGTDLTETPKPLARDFVNRGGIRKLARQMIGGQADRVTLIHGGELSGKSYCKYLFTYLDSAAPGFRAWVIDFELWSKQRRVTVERLVRRLAKKMGLTLAYGDGHGQAPREIIEWVEDFDTAARSLQETWCLFFDHIYKVEVPRETREFVESLALHVHTYPAVPVHIVIAGLRTDGLESDELRKVVKEQPMGAFKRDDGERWIKAIAQVDGIELDDAKLQEELNKFFPDGLSKKPPEQATVDLRSAIETAKAAL